MCGFQKGFIKTECQGGCNEVPHLFKAVMTMEQRKLLIRNGVEKIKFIRVPYSVPGVFTFCSIFGRMLEFEPELMRLQPGVLPMSYTHPT